MVQPIRAIEYTSQYRGFFVKDFPALSLSRENLPLWLVKAGRYQFFPIDPILVLYLPISDMFFDIDVITSLLMIFLTSSLKSIFRETPMIYYRMFGIDIGFLHVLRIRWYPLFKSIRYRVRRQRSRLQHRLLSTVVSSRSTHISMFWMENVLALNDLNFDWTLIKTEAKFGLVNSKKSQ